MRGQSKRKALRVSVLNNYTVDNDRVVEGVAFLSLNRYRNEMFMKEDKEKKPRTIPGAKGTFKHF